MNNLNLSEKKTVDNLKIFQEKTNSAKINNEIKNEIDNLYEKFSYLSKDIFKIIGEKENSKKKWELVFCPWLNYFLVSIVYKKYFYEYLIENKEDLFFLKYEKNKIQYFYDHNDFMHNTNNLEWNIECLKIFYELDLNVNNNLILKNNFNYKSKKLKSDVNLKTKIRFFFSTFLKKFFLNKKFSYFTFPHRFSLFHKILLFIKTNRGAFFEEEIFTNYNKNFKYKPDLILRDKINEILLSKGINKFIAYCFSLYLPLSKLENYNFYKSHISHNNFKNKNYKSVFTQASHIDNEFKLHNLYEDIEKGKKINVIQHGNNYDLIHKKFHTGIEHEYFFDGNLLTWGWSNYDKEKKITSPRLMKFNSQFRKLKSNFKNESILYVLGPSLIWNFPRSQHISHDFHHCCNSMRIKFNQNINYDLKKKLIFRNYPYKSYNGMRNLNEYNEFKDSNFSKNKLLAKDVSQSYMLIFDHLSTANLESSVSDKPFFLFFKLENYFLSNKGIKLLKSLRDNQILFEDPIKFSQFISNLDYENIQNWWLERKRKTVINNFFNEYAYFSKNAVDDWANLIKSENHF